MADISKVQVGQTLYNVKDATARTAISGMNSFEYVVCGSSAETPAGVHNGASVGSLSASASTLHKIYIVPSPSGEIGKYDSYVTISSGNSYSWAKIGASNGGTEIVRLA